MSKKEDSFLGTQEVEGEAKKSGTVKQSKDAKTAPSNKKRTVSKTAQASQDLPAVPKAKESEALKSAQKKKATAKKANKKTKTTTGKVVTLMTAAPTKKAAAKPAVKAQTPQPEKPAAAKQRKPVEKKQKTVVKETAAIPAEKPLQSKPAVKKPAVKKAKTAAAKSDKTAAKPAVKPAAKSEPAAKIKKAKPKKEVEIQKPVIEPQEAQVLADAKPAEKPKRKLKKRARIALWASALLLLFSLIVKFTLDYLKEQAAIRLAELKAEEEEKLAITLPKELPVIEVLTEFESEKLIQSYYGIQLVSDPEYLDTSTLGEKTILYTITSERYPDVFKTFEVKLEVKDQTEPVIEGVKNITVIEGNSKDLLAGISASDNFDGELDDQIELYGSYDFDKPGKYNLEVSVTDSSGNTATAEFILTVNKKPVVVVAKEKTVTLADTPAQDAGGEYYAPTTPTYGAANYSHPVVAAAMSHVGGRLMGCEMLVDLALQAVGVIPVAEEGNIALYKTDYYGNQLALTDWRYYSYGEYCSYVNAGDIQPGDILYWPGHVAVYIGDGQAVHGGWNGGNVVVKGINLSSGTPQYAWRCY